MFTRTAPTVAMIAALLASCTLADAGSIWARANRRSRYIYAEDTARDVGDLLTVVIAEKSKITSDTSRELDKSDSRQAKMVTDLPLVRKMNHLTGELFDLTNLDFSAAGKSSFTGETDFESNNTLADKLTVVVEDVLPNGNLVVLGKRTRETHGDSQVIEVSGIVRPSDVTATNTIGSDRVANFHIVVRKKGRENRFTRPGWLAQILNFLNPF